MSKRMTKLKEAFPANRPVATLFRMAWPGLVAAVVLFPACSSGSNLSCGTGTEKKGSTCVAKQAVTPPTGDAGTMDGSTGGATGSGGAGGTNGGGAAGTTDAGSSDKIDFGGVTSVSPSTPADGATPPTSLVVTWAPASLPAFPDASFTYEIYTATKGGGENYSTPAIVTPPGATSALLDGLSSTAPTFFVVRAVADVGDSKDTNVLELSGTPAVDSKPPTFAGATTAVGKTDSSVIVTWAAASDDLTQTPGIVYDVFWATSGTAPQQLAVVTDPGATQALVTGLPAAATQYFFRVAAVDAAGNVTPTTVLVTGTTGKDTTPPVFGGCRAAANPTASGGTIVWDPAVDDTTAASGITYNVYAFDVPVDRDTQFSQPDGVFKGVTQGQLTTLLPAGNYEVVCRAVDASGNEDTNRHTVALNTIDDSQPPTFPASGTATFTAGATTVTIDFPQATDNETAESAIQYVIFGGTTPGGEDMSTPIFTETGALEALLMQADLLKALSGGDAGAVQSVSNTDFYFLVEARDQAQNLSVPLPELHVTTLISFEGDVQPIFTAHCALAGCHVPGNPPEGQILQDGYAYSSVVNVVATESPQISPSDPVTQAGIKRVDATSQDPTHSYIWRKINGGTQGTIFGSKMPPAYTTGPQLTDAKDFATIQGWIVQGAQNN